jgi:hypothetical protein
LEIGNASLLQIPGKSSISLRSNPLDFQQIGGIRENPGSVKICTLLQKITSKFVVQHKNYCAAPASGGDQPLVIPG